MQVGKKSKETRAARKIIIEDDISSGGTEVCDLTPDLTQDRYMV